MKNINLVLILLLSIATAILFYRLESTSNNTYYIEPDKVYDNFILRQNLQAELEKSLEHDTKLLDSLYNTIGKYKQSKPKEEMDDLQQQLKSKNNELAEKYDAQIWAQINQYIIDYGKENNITFILGANGSGAVFYAETDKNITQNIIEYINTKFQNK